MISPNKMRNRSKLTDIKDIYIIYTYNGDLQVTICENGIHSLTSGAPRRAPKTDSFNTSARRLANCGPMTTSTCALALGLGWCQWLSVTT